MGLGVVVFLSHLGQGTLVDELSWLVSWNVFMLLFFAGLIGVALLRFPTKKKLIICSFILAAGFFYLVSEFGFKHLLVDVVGFSPRPYVAHADLVQPIGKLYLDTSFPSSHMAITVSMLVVFLFFVPAFWPYALGFAFVMAFSRMHNGMHYPLDVLIGGLLGVLYGLFGYRLARRIFGLS